jgi:hypothetical protein
MDKIIFQAILASILAFLMYGPVSLQAMHKEYGPGFAQRSIWFWVRALLYAFIAATIPFLLKELDWTIEWLNKGPLNDWISGIVIGLFASDIFNRIFSFAIVHEGKVKGALGSKGSLILSYLDYLIKKEITSRKDKLIEKCKSKLITSEINYEHLCDNALGYNMNESNQLELYGKILLIQRSSNTLTTEDSQNRGRITKVLDHLLTEFGTKKFSILMTSWYPEIFKPSSNSLEIRD